MNVQRRRMMYWSAGIVAAGLLAWLAPPADGVVVAQASVRSQTTRVSTTQGKHSESQLIPAVLQIKPRTKSELAPLGFNTPLWAERKSEEPAAQEPIATAAEAPAVPVVPPLPFRFMGRYVAGENPVLFLLHKDQTLAVEVGDIIDETYRVASIGDSEATLVYLPLDETQALSLSSN